jgi:hypothetical protein
MSKLLVAGAGAAVGAIMVYLLMKADPNLCPQLVCFPEQSEAGVEVIPQGYYIG